MNSETRSYNYLAVGDFKATLKFIFESYEAEFNFYTKLYNQCSEKDRYKLGIVFYNTLIDQPKRKNLYFCFLERQADEDPKSYKNVLRFLNEMRIKTEFQSY